MVWEEILAFPPQVVVNYPLKKVELKRQNELSSADIKLIDSAEIQRIQLWASINTITANVESYQDENVDYSQVLFLFVQISSSKYDALYKGITRLLQTLIPHHCVIISVSEDQAHYHISFATKRKHKQVETQRVIEEYYISNSISDDANKDFLEALKYVHASKQNLKVFYAYYLNVLKNYDLIDLTGEFVQRPEYVSNEYLQVSEQIRDAEEKIEQYIKTLKSTTQMSEKVRLNSDINAFKEEIQQLKKKIK